MILLAVPGAPAIIVTDEEQEEECGIALAGSISTASFSPSLDFSDERNSQYVGAL